MLSYLLNYFQGRRNSCWQFSVLPVATNVAASTAAGAVALSNEMRLAELKPEEAAVKKLSRLTGEDAEEDSNGVVL